jgi:hypothetical protein
MTEKGDVSEATYEQMVDDMKLSAREEVSGKTPKSRQAGVLPTGITTFECRKPLCHTVTVRKNILQIPCCQADI